MTRTPEAMELWHDLYPKLTEDRWALHGAMTARSEAHVTRLACIYALLDRSYVVAPEHLRAAVAFWEFCDRSVQYIFGNLTGEPIADKIMQAFRGAAPEGTTLVVCRYTDRAISRPRHTGSQLGQCRTSHRWSCTPRRGAYPPVVALVLCPLGRLRQQVLADQLVLTGTLCVENFGGLTQRENPRRRVTVPQPPLRLRPAPPVSGIGSTFRQVRSRLSGDGPGVRPQSGSTPPRRCVLVAVAS